MAQGLKRDSSGVSMPSLESLRRLAISESGFVFDPSSGHHFTVNETGLEILRHLQKEANSSELLEFLGQEYDSGTSELERDVLEFIGMLRKFVGD
ncbi:PqqD family protein [Congregibacter variabilis]|uniref:PqqD family protein n=1 Tax=Congregibacter variabilis TaxID=3081200 RepID=A0ABZ0I5F2_9GAMM|nr:PqqD family protein [Congregibacter sp. IMCC43200]